MFKGSIPALVTPFKDGEVDLEALKNLVDWHIEEGIARARARRHHRREPDAEPRRARAGGRGGGQAPPPAACR